MEAQNKSGTVDSAATSKLVDYDPDESSLEPGEVVTPPHNNSSTDQVKSSNVNIKKDFKETDACKERSSRLHKNKTDSVDNKHYNKKAHMEHIDYGTMRKARNQRNFHTYNTHQDENPFHGPSRNQRHFNARRGGRGYMRNNMSNYAHERSSPVKWSKPRKDIPESELFWTKVKPSISYWFKGCKEFMRKLQSAENHKTVKSRERVENSKASNEKCLKKPKKYAKEDVVADISTASAGQDEDDGDVDAWEEHFKKQNTNTNKDKDNKNMNNVKNELTLIINSGKKVKHVEDCIEIEPKKEDTQILTKKSNCTSELDFFEETAESKTDCISTTPPYKPNANDDVQLSTTPTKNNTKLLLTNNSEIKINMPSTKNNADDFDVLSIADIREQEAAEDRAKKVEILKNLTPTKNNAQSMKNAVVVDIKTEDIHNEEKEAQLLPDVSKDFKKLKALDNNLQRLQKMRESFDPTDDIWEELCKMEALFQKEKNFILLKYAKTESVDNVDLLPPALNVVPKAVKKRKTDGNSVAIVNDIAETHNDIAVVNKNVVNTATTNTMTPNPIIDKKETDPSDTGFLALNSMRETIKLKISPIKKTRTLQFNKKRNVLMQLWDDDDDEEKPLNAEPLNVSKETETIPKSEVQTVARQARGVAIVKPIMEVQNERHNNARKSGERRSGTAEKRSRRSRSSSAGRRRSPRRNQRSFSHSLSPNRNANWSHRRERNSPQFRRRIKNYRRSNTPAQNKRPRTPICTPPPADLRSRSPAFFKPPSPPTARSESPDSPRHNRRRSRNYRPRSPPLTPRRSLSPRSPVGYADNNMYGDQDQMYAEYDESYEQVPHNHEAQSYDIMQDINGYYYNLQNQMPNQSFEAAGTPDYAGLPGNHHHHHHQQHQQQQQSVGFNDYLPAQYYESDRDMYTEGEAVGYAPPYPPPHMNVNQSVLKELAKAPATAVQKGNVLEIVPIPNTEASKPLAENKLEFKENVGQVGEINKQTTNNNAVLMPKKTLNMKWKEEVENRQVQSSVMRTLPLKTTILKVPKNDQIDLNISNESVTKKPLLKQKGTKKKVFFEDGIYPSRDSSEEDRKAVDEILARKVKRLRKKLNDKQLKIIRQVAPELDDENISAELDALPPPPPPEGNPTVHLQQPVYLRSVSPDTFVFFHYDPEVCSMFVSAYEHAIPPRLLDTKNKAPTGAMTTLMLPFITPHANNVLQTENNKNPTATVVVTNNNATQNVRNAVVESPPPHPIVKPINKSRNEFVTQPLYPTTGPPLMSHPPPPIVPSPATSYYNTSHATNYMTQNVLPIEPLVTRAIPTINIPAAMATATRHV